MTRDVFPCFGASIMVLLEDISCIITIPITLDITSNHGVIVSSKTEILNKISYVSDATHGSLALKAYQQNLYLKYYY